MSSDSLQSTSKTFEFTKRKRWGDLLVAELADAVNMVFSDSCTVLYYRDFLELIATTDDQSVFQASFDEAIQESTDLHSFVRIKCSENSPTYSLNSKDILFEIQGRPRPVEPEGTFLFVTAKPYPSRNTEMLNTFLELKIENDKLQYRHSELSKHLPPRDATTPLTVLPSQIYATSPISGIPATATDAVSFDNLLEPPLDNAIYEANGYPSALLVPQEDDHEDGSKKKKPKKAQPIEQYVCVTCGRTDSPEWRKGPLGPKTLCNACGLRWAKQTRTEKADEAVPVC